MYTVTPTLPGLFKHVRDAWHELRHSVGSDGRVNPVNYGQLWEVYLQHGDPVYDAVLRADALN